MSNKAATPVLGGDPAMHADQAATPGYADRPYEKNLVNEGRRFISVDLDSRLLQQVDQLRGKRRRGIMLDELIADALACANPGSDHAVTA